MEEDEDNQSASNRRNGGRRGRGKKGRWLDCTPIEDRISFCKVLDVFRLFYWSFERYYVGFQDDGQKRGKELKPLQHIFVFEGLCCFM